MENINTQIPNNSPNQNYFKNLFFVFLSLFVIMIGLIVYLLIQNNKLISQLNINTSKETAPISSPTQAVSTSSLTPTSTVTEAPTPKPISDTEAIKAVWGDVPGQVLNIQKINGNYATGRIGGSEGGGAAWFMVKINGQWKTVWVTQDSMACQIADKYNIPEDMYSGGCYSGYPQEELNKYLNN